MAEIPIFERLARLQYVASCMLSILSVIVSTGVTIRDDPDERAAVVNRKVVGTLITLGPVRECEWEFFVLLCWDGIGVLIYSLYTTLL